MTTAIDVLGGLVVPDGRRWAAAATPVQWSDAEAVLADDGPRRHWIGRARGYSKTADAAGYALAALLSGGVSREHPIYAAAADRDQAALLLDSVAGYVSRTAGLAARVKVETWRASVDDASLIVLAADSSGAYGLRPSWLLLDELCQWPDTRGARRFHEALTTALPKVAGSRLVITTTAGSPEHWSKKVYDRALMEPNWRVSMTEGPPPWMPIAEVEAERRSLSPSAFERLFVNRWTASEDMLVNPDDLEAAAVLEGPLAPVAGRRYVIALDIGITNDATVVVVAHGEAVASEAGTVGHRVVVDRLWRWKGSRLRPVDLSEVEETIVTAHAAYPGPVVADPYQAVQLLQRLTRRGVHATKFDFTAVSVGRIAATLIRLLRSHQLWLPRDEVLLDELAGVRLRENSVGALRLDHLAGGHDDQAVALALAAHHLTDLAAGGPVTVHAPANRRLPDVGAPGPAGGTKTAGTGVYVAPNGQRAPVPARSRQAALVPPHLRRYLP